MKDTVFVPALRRERFCADRFDGAFQLLTVSGSDTPTAAATWRRVVQQLSRAKKDTDLLGWIDDGSTLALLLADEPDGSARVRAIQRRVNKVVEPASAIAWSVELHTYSGGSNGALLAVPEVSSTSYQVLKRTLDFAGSILLLTAFAPAFLAIAAVVKLTSPGPVLFRQVRVGQRARPFTMLKFRTMRAGVDYTLHQEYVVKFIASSGALAGGAKDPLFKIADDPRVTPVGHILRRFSLDELPQFWNVLRGDMSLVGPRPPLPYEVDRYKPWHLRRVFEAKPGVTGLWQVTGRSRTTFDDMVRLDLRYAKNRSIWTDIKILLATPRAVITGKGAC